MRAGHHSWSFEPHDLQRLESLLDTYLRATHARYVALVDRAGQLLGAAGSPGSIDTVSFASLAAADFAASGELAQLLGEDEFASLYHQAEGRGMFLVDVAGRAILTAVFDEQATLGLLRLSVRDVLPRLAEVFTEVGARGEGVGPGFEAGWLAEAESQIDRLFGA